MAIKLKKSEKKMFLNWLDYSLKMQMNNYRNTKDCEDAL